MDFVHPVRFLGLGWFFAQPKAAPGPRWLGPFVSECPWGVLGKTEHHVKPEGGPYEVESGWGLHMFVGNILGPQSSVEIAVAQKTGRALIA